MCKRKITESLEHIFVNCEKTKKLYEYIRKDFLKNKQLNNSLDLLRLKRGVLSCGSCGYKSIFDV